MPMGTPLFYVLVVIVALCPFLFVWHYWREAKKLGWNWISTDSRIMYMDAAKTLITAAGIAVALVASSAFSAVGTANSIVALSARVAVVCLIGSIFASLVAILALLRGFERAQSRYIGEGGESGQGQLSDGELLFILIPTALALASFLVGLLFLGRMTFHI